MRRPTRNIISFLCLCLTALFIISFYIKGQANQALKNSDEPRTKSEPAIKNIVFDKRNFTYDGNSEDISIEGDLLSILREGDYRLTGRLTEGRIKISCPDGGTVRLILGGVSMSSSYGAVIESDSCSLLILEAEENTVNVISAANCIKLCSALKEIRHHWVI